MTRVPHLAKQLSKGGNMYKMYKHFMFYNDQRVRGRFAIAFDSDRVEYTPVSGHLPRPEDVIRSVLVWKDLVEAANAHALHRKHDYKVIVHHGMSGAKDFIIIERMNDRCAAYPARARIHVSSRGRLNEPFSMWLGDLPPIITEMMKYYFEFDTADVFEVPARIYDGWTRAGSELLTYIHDDKMEHEDC